MSRHQSPTDTYCALVIGLCSHGLAISRSLHAHGVRVYAFEANIEAPGFKTNSAIVLRVQTINQDETLVKDLLNFRENFPAEQKIVVFPTNDNNVRIIAEHIEQIERRFIVSWASSAHIVKSFLLKSNIEQRCKEVGLLYPRSAIANDFDSINSTVPELGTPIIVKPVKPQSGFKAVKFDDQASVVNGLQDYVEDFPVILQEWIAGTDRDLFFCALYMDRGVPLVSFSGRKLESYPPALGQTTVAVTYLEEELIALTHKFFSGLDISGPVSLEFKRDDKGNFWVIEPTVGRTDFWLSLCIAAGLDLPVIEYQVSSGERQDLPTCDPQRCVIWFDSDRDPLAPLRHLNKWCSFRSDRYTPAFSYINIRDIVPFYRASTRTIRQILGKIIRKISTR